MNIKIKNSQGEWQAQCPFSVGDILTTKDATSPATRWPGTVWAAISGRVLVGYDASDADFGTIGKTGGSKTHTQTLAELAAHEHPVKGEGTSSLLLEWSGSNFYGVNQNYGGQKGNSPYRAETVGGGQPFNIMNPYEVVYLWERTA